jgi:murein DD-endopeptidase MepM/ murein hydrolase activator NlpD
MNKAGFKFNNNKGLSKIALIIILPFIILVSAFGTYKLFLVPDPIINGLEAFNFLPVNKTITLNVENAKSIDIFAYQGGEKLELLNDKPALSATIYNLEVKPEDLGLKDGEAIIIATLRSGLIKKVKHEIRSTIDTVPPVLEVLKSPSMIVEGSSGVAFLRAKGADSVFIRLKDHKFKAFDKSLTRDTKPVSNPETAVDKSMPGEQATKEYYVLFPAPFGIEESNIFYAVAQDNAGNQNIKTLSTELKSKEYSTSSINIDRSFIDKVVTPLLNEVNISDPENAFRRVNEEWRAKNQRTLIDIAGRSDNKILWKKRFLQMKNSKVMARYGDKRTYFYEGQEISKSVHLGYDLASFSKAPVEAANTGIVKFAGDLGIYGNTVIIDHGLGLMSLYGHLSMINVTEGQTIRQGNIIGKSGSTGLAGGDHLHMSILVHGHEVSPLYWWDSKWVKINVVDYLTY